MNKDLKLMIVEDDDIDFKSISRSLKKEETDIPIIRCIDGAEANTTKLSGFRRLFDTFLI